MSSKKGYGNVSPRFAKYFKNKKPGFDVGDRVRVVASSPYQGEEGRIVVRNLNIDGNSVWSVDFEQGAAHVSFLSNELERV